MAQSDQATFTNFHAKTLFVGRTEQNRMSCRLTSSPGTEWCTGRVWRTGIIQSKIFSSTPQCFASFVAFLAFLGGEKRSNFFQRFGETHLGNQGHTRRWEGDGEESKGVMTVVTFYIVFCRFCRSFKRSMAEGLVIMADTPSFPVCRKQIWKLLADTFSWPPSFGGF